MQVNTNGYDMTCRYIIRSLEGVMARDERARTKANRQFYREDLQTCRICGRLFTKRARGDVCSIDCLRKSEEGQASENPSRQRSRSGVLIGKMGPICLDHRQSLQRSEIQESQNRRRKITSHGNAPGRVAAE